MGEHHQAGNCRPQAGGNARPHDAQVQDKDKKVIPQHVEHAPGQDRAGGQGRPPIVAEKGRQHLGKEEEGHRELHRVQIIPRQRDQRLVPAEKAQQGDLKEDQAQPAGRRQKHRKAQRHSKGLVGLPALPLPPVRTGQHRTPNAGQQTQAVNDVPHRRHHSQRRCAVRPLILPHHRHVHQTIYRGQHGTAKGRAQILEVGVLYISSQQIHRFVPLPSLVFLFGPAPCRKKSRTGQQASQSVTLSSLPSRS